jgi:hypothetical protein
MNIIVGGFYLIASIVLGVLIFIFAEEWFYISDAIQKTLASLIILLGGAMAILAAIISVIIILQ